MFKSFTRIPLSSVSRSAFVWQPKPITLKTPTKFDFNLRNALTRSIHQNQTPLTKLPPNPILWKNNPKFTMQVTKRGPQSIQIRCATNWPNLGKIYTGLTQKIPNEIISTNYYHRMRRDLPLRYLGFTASIITLIVAAKYASVVLLTTGTAGLVASFVASASTVAILTAIILFLLGVAVIYPSLVIAEMVYIARELERLALEELSENSEVTSALGTPLMIAPAKQSEQIIGGHDSVYAKIRFVVEGPNGNAMVSVVGKRHYNGFFRGSTWETKYVKAEQLDENYKKTGKTLYKNEKVAADLSKVQTHQ